MTPALLALSYSLSLLGAGPSTADNQTQHEGQPVYDCGTTALFVLLRLEHHPTELKAIESHLPSPRPDGYSMKELRSAALACGLKLTGVILKKDDRAIDRPMLVYLKRDKHGHFLIIQPVGHMGKLVQIIDSV